MNIACVMVTENRAPIWGIGLASFLTQWHAQKKLLVVLPVEQEQKYRLAWEELHGSLALDPHHSPIEFVATLEGLSVPERLDVGCNLAFGRGADLVAIFDDDDWAPPDRLVNTASMPWNKSIPSYCSYTSGWFVNLRTLYGELIHTLPAHLWGGCLTFNQAGYDRADGFKTKPMPGYDRKFVEIIKSRGEWKEHRLPSTSNRGQPIAFSHGKNVATWLTRKGTPMEGVMRGWMPQLVYNEVLRCRKLMIDTRTFPPQPDL